MIALRFQSLLILCLATGLWAFGFGVGRQVMSHWLHDVHGASDEVIGLNHATYYLGIALAALVTPALMRRLGIASAGWGMALAGISLAVVPWTGTWHGWFGLLLVNGGAGAVSLIPLETLVSRTTPPRNRARHFSFYAVALTLGGALGLGIGLPFFKDHGESAFYLGALGPLLGGALVLAWLPNQCLDVEVKHHEATLPAARKVLSFGTAWSQGFLEGGMLAFLSLYLLSRGISAETAGVLLIVTTLGVLLFQVPVASLAGRWGTTAVLVGSYMMVLVGLATLPFLADPWTLGVALFLFGGFSGAMYPLGLALLADQTTDQALPRAYAWYLALECLGCLVGAAAMGLARKWWNEASMFAVGFGAVLAVLTVWTIVSGLRRRNVQDSSEMHESRHAA